MLETFFTDEDIKDIYDELVIYSIKKYEENKNMIESLDNYQQIYHTILKLNQPTTNEIVLQMKEILLSTLS